MADNGDGAKELWLTEMGWSTLKFPSGDQVSERERAVYMPHVGAMTRSWPWIGAVNFWHLRYAAARRQLLRRTSN